MIGVIFILVVCFFPANLFADSPYYLDYPVKLYKERDYYRSITEIMRIKYLFDDKSARNRLEMYLAKNYYQIGDFSKLNLTANRIINSRTEFSSDAARIMSLALLEEGKEKQAKKYWEKYVKGDPAIYFPDTNQIKGKIDPDRAKLYSSIIPGSGMILTGEYDKALVSFLLNAAFIAGIYHNYQKGNYGITGILFFFEVSWYEGGRNATVESVNNYNLKLTEKYQERWIKEQKTLLELN